MNKEQIFNLDRKRPMLAQETTASMTRVISFIVGLRRKFRDKISAINEKMDTDNNQLFSGIHYLHERRAKLYRPAPSVDLASNTSKHVRRRSQNHSKGR